MMEGQTRTREEWNAKKKTERGNLTLDQIIQVQLDKHKLINSSLTHHFSNQGELRRFPGASDRYRSDSLADETPIRQSSRESEFTLGSCNTHSDTRCTTHFYAQAVTWSCTHIPQHTHDTHSCSCSTRFNTVLYTGWMNDG